MVRLHRGFVAFILSVTLAHASLAVPPPNQISLNTCQATVRAEGYNFVKAEIAAIGACLQRISVERIRSNAAIDNTAARICIAQFRKLYDTRGLGRSLVEKLTARIRKKCDPGFNPLLTHTDDDITGKGSPTVPQPINTKQIDLYCTNFGGDGSIDGMHTPPESTVQEWVDCIVGAHQCEVEQAIAEQYPRASEWLSAVKPLMLLIPTPTTDTTRNSDAVTGLTNVDNAIDANGDNVPDITCPQLPGAPACATACCYMEYAITVGPTTFKPTSCMQYKGTTAEVSTFKSNCNATTASEPGFWTFSAADGVCSAGPTNHISCVVGMGSNAMAIPNDSACP